MAAVSYDVDYVVQRNRLTTAFRIILAIPHLIVSYVWGILTQVLAVIQWFIIVFTGKRNEGIWRLQQGWLGYYGRVTGYVWLQFDPYPAFGTDATGSPARWSLEFEEPANRLTNGLRFLWAIPAAVIGIGIMIAAEVLMIISWFAILFTGKQPRGMFDFVQRALRYALRLQAYTLLLTDTYPKFS